jgi:RNA-directed DNA polymerase
MTVPPTPIGTVSSREGWPGHPLFSLENVYRAYRQCRRRKRNTHNALVFERRLEDNLLDLHEQLERGTYRPGGFLAFLVDKPKRREIFCADFRDRVVHHLLVAHLERSWERRFIHDSFACRRGKGTHAGVERLRSFARKVTRNGTRRAWYLQLDVRGFFVTLDRRVLWDRFAAVERDPAVLWLLRLILFHEPTRNCRFRGARRADFERLPAHKTLFRTSAGCGLPIGNRAVSLAPTSISMRWTSSSSTISRLGTTCATATTWSCCRPMPPSWKHGSATSRGF